MLSMRKPLILTALLALVVAAPAPAQERDDVRYVGGEGANATLSSAVVVGNTIYLSGILPSADAGPTIQDQTRSVMENIRAQLTDLGASMDDVVKCLVFMADLSERPQLNEVYRSFFPDRKPARSAVGVDLGGPKVEIECIAVVSSR